MLALALLLSCTLEPTDFCFSPGKHCDDRLVELLDGATKSVDVAIYGLNRARVVDAIVAAKQRGVAVRVLLDNVQSAGKKEAAQLAKLDAAGVEHHHQHHAGIMHMKVAVVDARFVVWGSYNWTDPATEKNDEVVSYADCADVAARFAPEFEQRWRAARKAEQ